MCNLLTEGNNVNGEFPKEIGALSQMRFLYINGVTDPELYDDDAKKYLRGELPQQLENLTQMRVFDLGFNKLTGSYPSFLYNFSFISQIVLKFNVSIHDFND